MEHNVKLSSAETSQIWSSYMNDSAVICMLRSLLVHAEDKEIHAVLEYALEISQQHIKKLTTFFQEADYPLPHGFTEAEDLNLDAPKLFSDTYCINFISQLGKTGLNAYGMAVSLATKDDIFNYFQACLMESVELIKRANTIMLHKGLYVRPPFLPIPATIDFVKKQKFLTGFLGEKRSLTALEITHLYANIQRNALGVATMIAFSQAAEAEGVRHLMVRGKEIASKHIDIFTTLMRKDDVPAPMRWDTEVSASTVAPFSDKLMTFQTTALISLGMGYYGASIASSPRRDIAVMYTRLMTEIGSFAEDGANLMIKHGWVEEPPMSPNRDELAKG
ncbi:DUF3231 family protein [Ectobacillus antri]|uniref:DUF3231 family protein n=1 Tax=Ectobacillus antri TaxID=2486280 RepID=UPI000F59E085|nr:DUF3231 family protein [Ectobacillus antri]